MATKTISLRLEAYERLRRARRHPGESFSDVVLRARWDEPTVSAGEYLRLVRERGAIYKLADLERLDEAQAGDHPPDDKWLTD